MVVELAFLRRASPSTTEEEVELERGRAALGASMKLPCASPLYIGVEGAVFLPSKSIGALAKVGGKNHIISFPTDCYPPFLGILILSLRDMILFLLRWDLGAP